MGVIGAVLPYLLPESLDLCSSGVFRVVAEALPVITKFTRISSHPGVACTYLVVILLVAPVVAAVGLRSEPWNVRLKVARVKVPALWSRVARYLLASCLSLALLGFFYVFPGWPESVVGESRGQLAVYVFSNSRSGLAAIGSFVSAAVFSCWYLLLLAGSLCLAELTIPVPREL